MNDMHGQSNGAVVWVTGAASGIGRAVAELFALDGAVVVATDVKPIAATRAARTLKCDVANAADVDRVVAACDELGGVDTLVNCAGIMRRAGVLDVTPDIWDRVFDVNVKGVFLCTQAAVRSMQRRGKAGCIINVGSVNAEIVFADSTAYCASKGALHSMTRAIALAVAPSEIRVNTVAPGALSDTDLEPERWVDAREQNLMRSKTPLGTLGSVDDIAPAILFLSSHKAAFATGSTLYLDGGRTASV